MKTVAAKDLVGKELFHIFMVGDEKHIEPISYIYHNESDNYYEYNEYRNSDFNIYEFISEIEEEGSGLIECGLDERTIARSSDLNDIDDVLEPVEVIGELDYFDVTPDTPCGYYIMPW